MRSKRVTSFSWPHFAEPLVGAGPLFGSADAGMTATGAGSPGAGSGSHIEKTVPTPTIPQRAMTLQGSYVGNLDELRELMALVAKGNVPRVPLIERPLDDADAALNELRSGKVVGRIILKP